MSIRKLRSGRVVVDTFRDAEGRPKFIETVDITTRYRRVLYGAAWYEPSPYSKSHTPAASELDVPDLIEHFMEVHQMHWIWPNAQQKKLIFLVNSFPYCVPQAGDKLGTRDGRKVYTVRHVAAARHPSLWNGMVLLDQIPDRNDELVWIGDDTRRRCLVSFGAEDGNPGETTPPVPTSGDVGTAYPYKLGPTVTYILERQEPAGVREAFGQEKFPKPRFRESFPDPLAPQESIDIYGWWLDNIFRFRCIHPRTIVADRLAHWFKDFMELNRPSIKANGVGELRFWSRVPGARRKQEDDVAERIVRYFVRTEEIQVHRVPNIRHIQILVDLHDTLQEDVTGDPYAALDPFADLSEATGDASWYTLDIADHHQQD